MNKIVNSVILGVSLLSSSLVYAIPILNIVPDTTQLLVPFNFQGVITYTVTNNSNKIVNKLTFDPVFNSTVNPKAIGLQANLCAFAILNPGGSCTFQIVILGGNQPPNFQIRPRICAYNNAICSQPIAANTVNVTIVAPL